MKNQYIQLVRENVIYADFYAHRIMVISKQLCKTGRADDRQKHIKASNAAIVWDLKNKKGIK